MPCRKTARCRAVREQQVVCDLKCMANQSVCRRCGIRLGCLPGGSPGEFRNIAIVGHFPFIPKIQKAAKTLWVIEKNPREGDFSETDANDLIPRADVVAITEAALSQLG